MKRILALVLVLMMSLSLVACGGGGAAEESGGESGGASGGDAVNVSVFWYDESDVYLSSVRTALNKELDGLGVAYDNQYAANDQAKQLDQIKTAIAGGSDLLVINVVTSGSPDVAEEIMTAVGDMPVIFFNRAIGTDGADVTVLDAHSNACFIGTDAPASPTSFNMLLFVSAFPNSNPPMVKVTSISIK